MSDDPRATHRRSVGALGESIAARFLESKGFAIVDRNYRKKWGEIDIIAEKGNEVRFVEVKAMSVKDFSREKECLPEELVDSRKLKKLSRTAVLYMEKKGDDRVYQLDVVGVLLNKKERRAKCRLFEQVL